VIQSSISQISYLIDSVIPIFTPPPALTVSAWADSYRQLSPETCSEPGQWYTSRAEYLRGIMDAFNDPRIYKVVVKSSSQVGKTEILNNVVGYYISQDPGSILVVMPSAERDAKGWSRDRLAPMLRDTSCLRDLVRDSNQKDSGNTILHKTFPGGNISIVGANSPAGLSSRPIRIVLMDEIDQYLPTSHGDVIALAEARTKRFWNRKIGLFSTPTEEGSSKIDRAFNEGDQRYFWVPCVYCGEFQILQFGIDPNTENAPDSKGGIVWEKDENGKLHLPHTAKYKCAHCGELWDDATRHRAVKLGEWRATQKFNGVASFFINELYSFLSPLESVVKCFLAAKNNPEALKTWTNTTKGEVWAEQGIKIDKHTLLQRVEKYKDLPDQVVLLTCGADVHPDRIECEVVGWSKGEESWSIDYKIFHGLTVLPDIWKEFDDYLNQQFFYENGYGLSISCTCVDARYQSKVVHSFVKRKEGRHIYAITGANNEGAPIVNHRAAVHEGGVKVYSIGVDSLKTSLFNRLQVEEHGPGYCHFPDYEEEYFEQLTAEKQVTYFTNGKLMRRWKNTRGKRNEALDCRIYATAALNLRPFNLDKMSVNIPEKRKAFEHKETKVEQPQEVNVEEPVIASTVEPQTVQSQPQPKSKAHVRSVKIPTNIPNNIKAPIMPQTSWAYGWK